MDRPELGGPELMQVDIEASQAHMEKKDADSR